MKLEAAVKGMMSARGALRSKQGISDPQYISEQMQRLAAYTSAVEEHLAVLEEQIEVDEQVKFLDLMNPEDDGKQMSVNQAMTLAKQEVGSQKGEIAKLKRYVNSSWSLISTAQSRWNHLSKSIAGQI